MSYDFTVVIPFYEGHDDIYKLLNSLPDGLPVIIVDDCSEKPLHIDDINCKVIRLADKGYFSGAVNAGIEACNTDVLVLNQDTWFEGLSWIDLLMENKREYALIGERIKGNHPAWPKGYIHGTFMYMRRDAIRSVGKLDEKNYPLWGSTCEWQLRACRKGFKVLPLEEIPTFMHSRGKSDKYGSSIKKLLQLRPLDKGLFIRTPPLVSVVVSCYNYGRYVEDLVNSLIGGKTSLGYMQGQTFQSFEIILVDDCSTDDSFEILQSLADPWKGIWAWKTPRNGGTSYTNNYGIEKSHGQYITVMCADDMREEHSLQVMYDYMQINPHSFIYDDMRILANGRRGKIWKMQDFDFPKLLHKNQVHCGIMFPYQAWKDTGGYPEIMAHGREDWAFNIALGAKGYCGVHVDYPGYIYRREGQNRTLTNTSPKNREVYLLQLQSLYPRLYKGEFPMGCCGGSRVKSNSGRKIDGQTKTAELLGADGMTIVNYVGGNYGNMTFYGPATGTTYKFSAKKYRGLVDDRDLYHTTKTNKRNGILELSEQGKILFTIEAPGSPSAPIVVENENVVEISVDDEDTVSPNMISDLYDTGLDAETVEYLMEKGFDSIESISSASNTKLKKALEYTLEDVKALKAALSE